MERTTIVSPGVGGEAECMEVTKPQGALRLSGEAQNYMILFVIVASA